MPVHLHLTVKTESFVLIESHDKRHEYREIKPYWIARIGKYINEITSVELTPPGCPSGWRMIWTVDQIIIGRGNPLLGAPADRDVYIIYLGEQLL